MSEINTGGPAFPVLHFYDHDSGFEIQPSEGMTLRDYFAAKAMPIVAAEVYCLGRLQGIAVPDLTAKMAYEFADALLKAREQQ